MFGKKKFTGERKILKCHSPQSQTGNTIHVVHTKKKEASVFFIHADTGSSSEELPSGMVTRRWHSDAPDSLLLQFG